MQKIELELRENSFQKRLWLVNEEFYFKFDQWSLNEYKKYEYKKDQDQDQIDKLFMLISNINKKITREI